MSGRAETERFIEALEHFIVMKITDHSKYQHFGNMFADTEKLIGNAREQLKNATSDLVKSEIPWPESPGR